MPTTTDLSPPIPGMTEADLPAIAARDCATGEPIPDPVCPCCEQSFDADDGIVPGDDSEQRPHCPECVHSCDECGVTTADEGEIQLARSHGRSRTDDVALCPNCRQTCHDCNHEFSQNVDGGENTSGEWVCERCAESYCTCEDCNETLLQEESHYHDGREQTFCQSCYDAATADDGENENGEDEDEDKTPVTDRIIRAYSYKPTPIFFQLAGESSRPKTAYFGLEIEAEHIGSADRQSSLQPIAPPAAPLWYVKEDSSVPGGAEFVSHPATWKFWQAHSFDMFGKLRADWWRSWDTATCGMHVHISRAAFTDLALWKLMEFFRRNETLIARLSRRQGKSLAKWAVINGGPGGPSTRPSCKIVHPSGCKRQWNHVERYAAINLENEHTVEIRIFRGTLDVPSIKRNIALCVALAGFARHTCCKKLAAADFVRYIKAEATDLIGQPEAVELVKWVTKQVDPVDTGS